MNRNIYEKERYEMILAITRKIIDKYYCLQQDYNNIANKYSKSLDKISNLEEEIECMKQKRWYQFFRK